MNMFAHAAQSETSNKLLGGAQNCGAESCAKSAPVACHDIGSREECVVRTDCRWNPLQTH